MPTKVYRNSFERVMDTLPNFKDVQKADVIFMICEKPLEASQHRTFTPAEPYDPPFLKFRRNYETEQWELVDDIELVDESIHDYKSGGDHSINHYNQFRGAIPH